MNHSEIDQVSLEMARRVADRVRHNPALLEIAHGNLVRWSRQNASVGSLLRSYAEWEKILSRPADEICELLCSDDAQRLRQNSPFVGVLSPAEVWEIKSRLSHLRSKTNVEEISDTRGVFQNWAGGDLHLRPRVVSWRP